MADTGTTSSVRAVFFDAVGTLLTPAEPVSATYRFVAQRHGAGLDEATIRARLRESFEKQERLDYQAGWRTNEPREAERWRTIVRETLREVADPDLHAISKALGNGIARRPHGPFILKRVWSSAS